MVCSRAVVNKSSAALPVSVFQNVPFLYSTEDASSNVVALLTSKSWQAYKLLVNMTAFGKANHNGNTITTPRSAVENDAPLSIGKHLLQQARLFIANSSDVNAHLITFRNAEAQSVKHPGHGFIVEGGKTNAVGQPARATANRFAASSVETLTCSDDANICAQRIDCCFAVFPAASDDLLAICVFVSRCWSTKDLRV